jgi:hypothetical protein
VQLSLGPLLLGDIACYHCCPDHGAGCIPDGKRRERHVNVAAVLTNAHSFILIYALAVRDSSEEPFRLFSTPGRKEQ